MTFDSYHPQPRAGLLGAWDRFVGPGMRRDETALVLGTSVIGAALAAWGIAATGAGVWLMLLAALIAFDVIGGAVCNATETTKRWYHRPGATLRDHAGFVALHVLHIALVAWAFRGEGIDLAYAAVLSACLILAMAAVLISPGYLKLPVAVTFCLIAIGLVLYVLGPTPGLEWFVPALFLKLLVGHLVP